MTARSHFQSKCDPPPAKSPKGDEEHGPGTDDGGERAAGAQRHGLSEDGLFAHTGALMDRAVGGHDCGEAGGCGLKDPAIVFDRTKLT